MHGAIPKSIYPPPAACYGPVYYQPDMRRAYYHPAAPLVPYGLSPGSSPPAAWARPVAYGGPWAGHYACQGVSLGASPPTSACGGSPPAWLGAPHRDGYFREGSRGSSPRPEDGGEQGGSPRSLNRTDSAGSLKRASARIARSSRAGGQYSPQDVSDCLWCGWEVFTCLDNRSDEPIKASPGVEVERHPFSVST